MWTVLYTWKLLTWITIYCPISVTDISLQHNCHHRFYLIFPNFYIHCTNAGSKQTLERFTNNFMGSNITIVIIRIIFAITKIITVKSIDAVIEYVEYESNW